MDEIMYTRENPPPGTTHLRRGSETHIFYKVLSDGSAMSWSNTQRDWLKSRIFKGIPQALVDPVSHKAAATEVVPTPTPMPSDLPGIRAQPAITPAPAFMLVDHKPAKPNEGLLTVAEISTIGGVKLWGDDA